MLEKLFIAYIAANEHTPAFDSARASTPGRTIGILKRRYPEYKDLTLWASLDLEELDSVEGISHEHIG